MYFIASLLIWINPNNKRTIGRPKTSWVWEFFDFEIRNNDGQCVNLIEWIQIFPAKKNIVNAKLK